MATRKTTAARKQTVTLKLPANVLEHARRVTKQRTNADAVAELVSRYMDGIVVADKLHKMVESGEIDVEWLMDHYEKRLEEERA